MSKTMKMVKKLGLWALMGLAGSVSYASTSTKVGESLEDFIQRMVKTHQMDEKELTPLLTKTKVRQDIIDLMNKPAESLPWHRYRPIWIKDKRIKAGIEFWNKYQTELLRAEKTYQVPASIIVGILGVETYYGRIQGKIPVIEALVTLGFHYPKRAKFFRKELEEFLLLCKEQNWSPLTPKGSYAGAMGMGQFISSSYRNYAVDFDGDGKVNLFDSPVDAIGSVANYFKQHKWRWGQPVAYRVTGEGKNPEKWAAEKLKPMFTAGKLYEEGYKWPVSVVADASASLYPFEQEKNKDYWIGFNNFYVITRYNRSALYALAVYQFSQEVIAARARSYVHG
ncbi:lytic murein transglycosylase B [Pleionea sp. CnH1-48]|uniref:lytic murein transglycosylase B n=1 Tax=Pleionea sp. CnH1-48 TaxID=2954494 RepID=UPI0020968BD0|nr:lytic murein transglycosylase B [Pleionea sp. CnH1-48]MCO7227378.1 lytic murein transglycosylase B [Pleionea sp. CnH1-48]